MTTTLLGATYLGIWAALAAGCIYGGMAAGHSPLVMAGLVFVMFFVVNGCLAYFLRSRQLRLQGEQPPRFVNYLFQTDKLGQPLKFPSAIRVSLGLVVIFGGALFVFGGGVFVFSGFDRLATLLVGFFFVSLGTAFAYVGYRVIRMSRPGQRLFGSDQEVVPPNPAPQRTPASGRR